MFKLNEIRELIRLLDETSISEFNYELEGTKLLIKKQEAGMQVVAAPALTQPVVQAIAPAPAVVAAPTEAAPTPAPAPVAEAVAPSVQDPSLHKIVSPMVGTFYASPAPDAAAYVQKGSKVTEKTIVCIVEAMKLMNEIEADVKGEIVEVLAENGQLVEYGQPLFLVKAN